MTPNRAETDAELLENVS